MATFGFLCCTPRNHCRGAVAALSAGLEKRGLKKHGTRQECFECYSAYLINIEGYEKISSREFRKEGQPILVLSKVAHHGARLRMGKGGEGQKGNRGMPTV